MVSFKDVFKLLSVIALSFCSVLICTVFVNYSLDLREIAASVTDTQYQIVYDALIAQGNVAVAAAGGTLGTTTLVVLLFSIGQFINGNSSQLGVMKALGYGENRIAVQFIKFGCCILSGAIPAYVFAYLGSPVFYGAFSGSGDLPIKIVFGFHIETVLSLIVAPAIIFSLLSFLFARLKLNKSALSLIKCDTGTKVNKLANKMQAKDSSRTFLQDLKRSIFTQNLTLIFFVWFASLGFSSCIQIAFSLRQITDAWVTTAIFVTLGFLTGVMMLLLALSFVVNKNKQYIAVLKAYGFTDSEYNHALFGGYRVVAYIGFACGTIYQFLLLKNIAFLFAGMYEISEIKFNFVGLFTALAAFVLLYELILLYYKRRIAKISLRRIMQSA